MRTCHVAECDEEELQRCPIDWDAMEVSLVGTGGLPPAYSTNHILNVFIEALSDQRRAATQQREIAECRSASDAGG